MSRLSKALKYGILIGGPGLGLSATAFRASDRQRECVKDILSNVPSILRGGGLLRFLRSLHIGLSVSLDYKISLWNLRESEESYSEILSSIHRRSATKILEGCLSNGGLYIKLGQGLVSLNHVLPKEYTETLKVLQNQCLRRQSENEVIEIFKEDFDGALPEDLFESFDSTPIAAASLAQVFRATTKKGESVAVKVQYKDLQERFTSDIPTIESILDIAELIHPLYSFKKLLVELRETLRKELDFKTEARNSILCSQQLQHLKDFFHVPQVHESLSSKRILTTEFIDGIQIDDTQTLEKAGISIKAIDTELLTIFAEQIFRTGFLHGDPHPGNILIRCFPSKKHERQIPRHQIVLLDHGLYQELSEAHRQSLCFLWKGIVENNHEEMKRHCASLGIEDYRLFSMMLAQKFIAPPKGCKDEFLQTYTDSEGRSKTFSKEEYNKCPKEVKEKLREVFAEYQERLLSTFSTVPSSLFLVLRNLNTIRSIIRDHGSGVDRYIVLARAANRGMHSWTNCKRSIFSVLQSHFDGMVFDIRLLVYRIKMYFLRVFIRRLEGV